MSAINPITYQILVDKEVVAELDSKDEAIQQAQHQRPKPRWIEVRRSDGFQVFAEHEFEHDDHLTRVRGLISLLEGGDSGMPPADVVDHLRRTTSICETVLLTLPGRYGYAGVTLSCYQCIAKPVVQGCNRHFYVLTEGYSEGYRADLYTTKGDALTALQERLGTDNIPLAALLA